MDLPYEIVPLKVGTSPTSVEIVSEVDVTLTFRGYAPLVYVKVEKSGLIKSLFVSAKSLAEPLENLRKENDGNFAGIKMRISKESDEKFAKYVLESFN